MTDKHNYTPNQVSLSSRMLRTAGAVVLIAHGVIGIVSDDVIIPTKRSALHLHGLSGWITAGAMFCAAIVLLAVVVDHFDRRDNELAYQQFGRWMARAAWALMGLGMGFHTAGINYPAPSSMTTGGLIGGLFIVLFTGAIGFANEKAVERSARTPDVAPPSEQGTASEPRVAKALAVRLDRRFAGLLFMVIGGLLFLAALPGLVKFLVIQYVIAALAVIFAVAGWLLFSGGKVVESEGGGASPTQRRNWRPIRIGVLLVVGLGSIWYAKASQWGKWLDQDEAERKGAPAWNYSLEDFGADVTQADVQKAMSAAGFRMRCYGGLGPNEKMNEDDTSVCWTIANNVGGIPSRMITFVFGSDGLHNIRLDFPKDQWKAAEKWFQTQGVLVEGGFGRDQSGSKVLGRRGPTGLVMTSEPGLTGWVMVLYQPRDRFVATTCVGAQSNEPNWPLLCRDWPEPAKPSNFVRRHRPPEQWPAGAAPNATPITQGQS